MQMIHSQTQGRSRRTGNGTDHQRPENLHDDLRGAESDTITTGRGHSTSAAATIAAASISVGAGLIENWA